MGRYGGLRSHVRLPCPRALSRAFFGPVTSSVVGHPHARPHRTGCHAEATSLLRVARHDLDLQPHLRHAFSDIHWTCAHEPLRSSACTPVQWLGIRVGDDSQGQAPGICHVRGSGLFLCRSRRPREPPQAFELDCALARRMELFCASCSSTPPGLLHDRAGLHPLHSRSPHQTTALAAGPIKVGESASAST